MNHSSKQLRTALVTPLLLICATMAAPAKAAGDIRHGSDVFAEECAECHSVREGKQKKGPSLFAVLGRKSASQADFNYSDALRQSGIVWTADRLEAYVAAPKKTVPGGKMKYDGLLDARARADLIAYLGTVHN